MNRLHKLKEQNKKHLIIYLMAGDPDIKTTEKLIYLLDELNVSVIELGVPFSDPIADGVTIQRAGERALKQGVNLLKVFYLVKNVRKKVKIPIVLMTYYNIIFNYGVEKFIIDAKKSGIDGVIIPDLPFDEEKYIQKKAKENEFCIIYLVSPTNTLQRAKKIVEKSQGFVYYILIKGVTGTNKRFSFDLNYVKNIKKLTEKPIFAGFGISKPQEVKKIMKYFDGIIIGSAFVNIIEKYSNNKVMLFKKSKDFINSFSNEVNNVR